ncbi:hypothetical protein A5717_17665 [Mycolicibacterium porcinum]|nr:hypothetical protein A5717_17665 [Mycolicibacterium porcinum]
MRIVARLNHLSECLALAACGTLLLKDFTEDVAEQRAGRPQGGFPGQAAGLDTADECVDEGQIGSLGGIVAADDAGAVALSQEC